jgi:exonuclease SbcD
MNIMQILHTSDTHLGCAQFEYAERERDVYDAFQEIIDTAVKDKVDAVIHAGDIFDIPKPGGTPLLKLAEGVKTLSDAGIRLYFTLGEHDISRITGTPSPYIFHKLGLATYIGDGKPVYHGGMMIAGFHKRRRGEVDELIENMKRVDSIAKTHEGKSLVVIHQALSEFHEWAGELTADDLPPHFDYYAMGHLHDHLEKRFERLGGPVCYPGSIDPTPGEGIKEFKKGFFMVDTSGEEARQEWIEIRSSRHQYRFDVDYDAIQERIGEIIQDLQSKDLKKKPIVLLNVKGREIDNARIASFLSRLLSLCLHYSWDIISDGQGEGGLIYSERPSDIRDEMLKLARDALGNEELASFAVKELLPLLEADQKESASELVERAFETLRFGGERR